MEFGLKLAQIKELEDRLEDVIRTDGMEDVKVTRQRYEYLWMRSELVVFSCDIGSAFWNIQPVDYYRRRVRDSKSPQGRWAFCELNRIIDSGIAFIATLLHELVSLGNVAILDEIFKLLGLPPARPTDTFTPGLNAVIYRLLIFCGDLARYRSQFNKYFQEDSYQLSWRIYVAAREMNPDHGHACNQIAVICSMLQDVLMTVLWYLRAECCALPFTASRTNLKAYLEKVILKDTEAVNEVSVWKPFMRFINDALSKDTLTIDTLEIETWMRKRVLKMSSFEFASILMILGAAARITGDFGGSFRQCLGRFLNVFVQTDSKASVHQGTNDDRLFCIAAMVAVWRLTDTSQCEQVVRWLGEHRKLILSSKSMEMMEQLQGFDIFEPILESLPSEGSEFLSELLARDNMVPELGFSQFAESSLLIDHASPVEEHQNPVERVISAEEQQHLAEHASPVEKHSSPVGEHASPVGEHANPVEGHASPVGEHASSGKEHASPGKEHQDPGEHTSPPVDVSDDEIVVFKGLL
ncbi:hypothetical protein PSACC_02526 [Paramicrosporidium saccamoebae]|uniref:DNA/RNA-binding domain-containing protein n=1 Tax=Paramicrosporidium saccamoebae TaxID=1246581 RepID=A0A2H9TIX6_9FUNG|nr:hypothetical protein PSACC_02526 [Paramicrosporidium saccamoebae]